MKNFRVLFFSVIAIVLLHSCNTNSKSAPRITADQFTKELDSLDHKLTDISKASIIPGFAAQILHGDELIYAKGFGFSDLANQHLFTPQTIHNLASISKTFIGVAIMLLVEEGKLALDDPINDFLPFEIWSPHFPETVITVRHLVSHTSSLNDNFDDGEKRASELKEPLGYKPDDIPESLAEDIHYWDGTFLSLEKYLEQAFTPNGKFYEKGNFSNFKPGEKSEYSNEGSNLAALIVEKVSGMPFSDFVNKQFFLALLSIGFEHFKVICSL